MLFESIHHLAELNYLKYSQCRQLKYNSLNKVGCNLWISVMLLCNNNFYMWVRKCAAMFICVKFLHSIIIFFFLKSMKTIDSQLKSLSQRSSASMILIHSTLAHHSWNAFFDAFLFFRTLLGKTHTFFEQISVLAQCLYLLATNLY